MKSTKNNSGVYTVTFSQVDSNGKDLSIEITVHKCSDRGVWCFGGYVTRNGYDGSFPEYLLFTANTKKEIMEYLLDCETNGFDY